MYICEGLDIHVLRIKIKYFFNHYYENDKKQ